MTCSPSWQVVNPKHFCTLTTEEVIENLYVGTVEGAETPSALQAHDIDTIVSLTFVGPEVAVPQDIDYTSVPMMDGPRNDSDEFSRAVTTVLERLRAGDCVLVHCSAGASRSVAVAAVAVALLEGCDIERAFQITAASKAEATSSDAPFLSRVK